MDYGLDGNWRAVAMGGSEFPFGEGGHGVFVEDGIEGANDLDAIDGTIFTNDAEEDDFAFDVRFHLFGRITWIGFVNGYRTGKCAGTRWRGRVAIG